MVAQQNSRTKHVFEQVKFLGLPVGLNTDQENEFFACLQRAWEAFDPQDEVERILTYDFVRDTFEAVPVRQLVAGLMTSAIEFATKDQDEEDEDPLTFLIEDEGKGGLDPEYGERAKHLYGADQLLTRTLRRRNNTLREIERYRRSLSSRVRDRKAHPDTKRAPLTSARLQVPQPSPVSKQKKSGAA